MHIFEYNTAVVIYLVVFFGLAAIATVASLGVAASLVLRSFSEWRRSIRRQAAQSAKIAAPV